MLPEEHRQFSIGDFEALNHFEYGTLDLIYKMKIIFICLAGFNIRINHLILDKQFEHEKHYINEGKS